MRQKFLDSVHRRDLFLEILEQVRAKDDFVVAGCVVMPERFQKRGEMVGPPVLFVCGCLVIENC